MGLLLVLLAGDVRNLTRASNALFHAPSAVAPGLIKGESEANGQKGKELSRFG